MELYFSLRIEYAVKDVSKVVIALFALERVWAPAAAIKQAVTPDDQRGNSRAGAGFRRAPVRFFPTNQLAAARAWLTA